LDPSDSLFNGGKPLLDNENSGRFRSEIAPHLDAAYNLARWLTNNAADAEDVLQEACLKAYCFIGDLRSGEAKPWFFQIVRNESYNRLKKRGLISEIGDQNEAIDPSPDAETSLLKAATGQEVRLAIEQLPTEFRETLILRELEELSYQEISKMTQVPEGTVMSRLSRARTLLRSKLLKGRGSAHG
jgi:RNA polymerase sigma-70 factor, ECF subfamily